MSIPPRVELTATLHAARAFDLPGHGLGFTSLERTHFNRPLLGRLPGCRFREFLAFGERHGGGIRRTIFTRFAISSAVGRRPSFVIVAVTSNT